MDRRTFLTGSAVAATATLLKTPAAAENAGPCSETGVTLRYPDIHIESRAGLGNLDRTIGGVSA